MNDKTTSISPALPESLGSNRVGDEAVEVAISRGAQVMLFAIGTLDDLKSQGLVHGGFVRQTPEGRARYEQLKASGFQPTDDELFTTLAFLQNEGLRQSTGADKGSAPASEHGEAQVK